MLSIACGKTHPARSDQSLDQAKREFRAAHFERALAALPAGEQASAESLDLRGEILLEQGKFDDALSAFDAAHQAQPAIFAPRLHRGDVFLRQGKFADARREYQTLLDETNILISHERLRYAIMLTFLGEQNDEEAKRMLEAIKFPTESAAFYFAQAAWAYAHKDRRTGDEWTAKAHSFYNAEATAWFERPLFDLGWSGKKPPLVYSAASN